ncbi:MAG: peptidoglycan-binding domain-containing protein, partial [Paracoccaceae bacterium]
LLELGYSPGVVDNTVDSTTHQAIAQYQRDRGLPVTGGMSHEEYLALEREIVHTRGAAQKQLPNSASQQASNPQGPPQATTPDDVSGVIYHRLANCTGERGMMLYTYQMDAHDTGFSQISDICWHASQGLLEGVEPEGNLTLVQSDDGYEIFENLSTGSEGYQRTSVDVTRTNNLYADGDPTDLSVLISHRPRTEQRAPSNGAILYRDAGFLITSAFSPQIAQSPLEVRVDIRTNHTSRDVCSSGAPSYSTGEPGNIALVGTIDLSNPQVAKLRPPHGTTGRAEGTLTLSFSAAGEVRGKVSVLFENPRVVGHGPCEWLRAEVTLDAIVDTTSGATGVQFNSLGVGRGRYTDVNESTYPLSASGSVQGFLPGS